MAEENINKSQEAEVFTIPEEFYGAQRRPATPHFVAGSVKTVSQVPAASVATATHRAPKKTGLNLSSPKFVITAIAVFLVLVVGGFSLYYIRQAQVARQKLIEAQKQKEQPLPTPEPVQPAAPEVPPPTEQSVTPTSTEPVAPQPISYAVFPFKNYTKAEDADNDGLTSAEEALYSATIDKPDTDEDGFFDGLEVENLYNPLGFKPVRLLDSEKVKSYVNPTYNYSILYPSLWVAQALDANNEQVIFSSDTGEFIEVIVEDNPLKLSVADWYLGQSPGVSADELKAVTTKNNLTGILSPDGLAAYFPFEDRIFVIYYNIGLKTEVNFLTTFKMMLNSFQANVVSASTPETIFSTPTTTAEEPTSTLAQ